MIAQGHGDGLAQGQHSWPRFLAQGAGGVDTHEHQAKRLRVLVQAKRQALPAPVGGHQARYLLLDQRHRPLDGLTFPAPGQQPCQGNCPYR